jgi:hypothetical protein
MLREASAQARADAQAVPIGRATEAEATALYGVRDASAPFRSGSDHLVEPDEAMATGLSTRGPTLRDDELARIRASAAACEAVRDDVLLSSIPPNTALSSPPSDRDAPPLPLPPPPVAEVLPVSARLGTAALAAALDVPC